MRVTTNFTVSCNVVTDVQIPDDIDQTDRSQMSEAIDNEIIRMLHVNRESVIDKGGCLMIDMHDFKVVK